MKSNSLFLLSISGMSTTAAFMPTNPQVYRISDTSLSASSSGSSRRIFLEAAAAAAAFLGPAAASAEPRPMYLTEPTDEFKDSEAKAAEFKRQQLAAKKAFTTALDKLVAESNDEDALIKDLKDIQALVAKTGGLPQGIKKEEMYKIIRTKKAEGFWPTAVEVAYQSLKAEISFQQSPNVEKDLGNFYQ